MDDNQGFELDIEHLPQHQSQNLEETTTSPWFKNENDEQT